MGRRKLLFESPSKFGRRMLIVSNAQRRPIVKTTRLKEWDRNAKKRWAGLQGEQQQKLQKVRLSRFHTSFPTCH